MIVEVGTSFYTHNVNFFLLNFLNKVLKIISFFYFHLFLFAFKTKV